MQIKEHTNYSHNNGMWFFCILWYDNDKVWQMVENVPYYVGGICACIV